MYFYGKNNFDKSVFDGYRTSNLNEFAGDIILGFNYDGSESVIYFA